MARELDTARGELRARAAQEEGLKEASAQEALRLSEVRGELEKAVAQTEALQAQLETSRGELEATRVALEQQTIRQASERATLAGGRIVTAPSGVGAW